MDRKKFLKQMAIGSISTALGTSLAKASDSRLVSSEADLSDRIGFNHLPNKEIKTMKTILHKAETRGHADHGWLNSHHTFSFANYHNPERMQFGALRVLNDDRVAPGRGFGTHPHSNMEIISIPLEGDLEHKDSMGTSAVIKEGEVQVMSAGTGVYHSEYNKNNDREVKFLQIWIFPKKTNVTPRYDQMLISDLQEPNEFSQILSPSSEDQGVWINQDVWFHVGAFEKRTQQTYQLKKEGNGVYAFILKGNATINDQELGPRDGFGVWDTNEIVVNSDAGTKILLMEVPMN